MARRAKKPSAAIVALLKAAGQDDVDAQYELAAAYRLGRGVRPNYVEALKWLRKAADHGDARAQNDLGMMYDEGRGVTQDYVQAYMWAHLSGAASEGKEQEEVKRFRDAIAVKMTRQQTAEAQKLAGEWKPKPAE